MQYTEVKNCKWANAEHTMLDCEVNFSILKEEFVPFTAVAEGDTEHAHNIFARAIAGEFGDIEEYTPPPELTAEEKAFYIRADRDRLLQQSDWTQLPDVPPTLKSVWSTYRQQLRDITEQSGFPESVVFPTPPQ